MFATGHLWNRGRSYHLLQVTCSAGQKRKDEIFVNRPCWTKCFTLYPMTYVLVSSLYGCITLGSRFCPGSGPAPLRVIKNEQNKLILNNSRNIRAEHIGLTRDKDAFRVGVGGSRK